MSAEKRGVWGWIAIVVLAVVVVIGGCKKAADVELAEGPEGRAAPEGTANLRDWIPVPGGVETVKTFSTETDDAFVGGFRFTTDRTIDDIVAFYRDSLGDDYEFEVTGLEVPDGPQRQVVARTPDKTHVLHIMINSHEKQSQVHLQYQEKR